MQEELKLSLIVTIGVMYQNYSHLDCCAVGDHRFTGMLVMSSVMSGVPEMTTQITGVKGNPQGIYLTAL